MLMEDEGTVIAGLLVGLNVIDCTLGIKDEDLDQPVSHLSHDLPCFLCNIAVTKPSNWIC